MDPGQTEPSAPRYLGAFVSSVPSDQQQATQEQKPTVEIDASRCGVLSSKACSDPNR